jgi:hypothetical protein
MYLAFIILVKTPVALSSAFGERDGMDAEAHWMMCSIYRNTRYPLRAPRCWGLWAYIVATTYVDFGIYTISIPIPPFAIHQGRPEWVDGINRLVYFTYSVGARA